MNLQYKTIPAETTSREANENVMDLLDKIQAGWEILSAVGVAGGVHYILALPDREPVLPTSRKPRRKK